MKGGFSGRAKEQPLRRSSGGCKSSVANACARMEMLVVEVREGEAVVMKSGSVGGGDATVSRLQALGAKWPAEPDENNDAFPRSSASPHPRPRDRARKLHLHFLRL